MKNLEGRVKTRSWPILRYYPRLLLEGKMEVGILKSRFDPEVEWKFYCGTNLDCGHMGHDAVYRTTWLSELHTKKDIFRKPAILFTVLNGLVSNSHNLDACLSAMRPMNDLNCGLDIPDMCR
jgi:hypothetical protein